MNQFDPRKPVQTRDGKPVTLVLFDARGPYPLRGYIGEDDAILRGWEASGSYFSVSDRATLTYRDTSLSLMDLVNVPVKHELWVSIYGGAPDRACGHSTRKYADLVAAPSRIACVRVEYTEGEGL